MYNIKETIKKTKLIYQQKQEQKKIWTNNIQKS